MLALGNIINNHDISFHCYDDDTQLHVTAKPDEKHKHNKTKDRVKDIRHWMLTNSHLNIF